LPELKSSQSDRMPKKPTTSWYSVSRNSIKTNQSF
jgi:hypothetical protein